MVLAGGSGTRFWPLSTPVRPKQLLPLTGDRSTAVQAVDRLHGLISPAQVLAVTGAALASPVRAALRLDAENVLIEPRSASTAPALVWASWEAYRRDPDAEVLSLHADWAVGDDEKFRETARTALRVAREHDRLVTVGVVPSRPETGYGYIVPGSQLGDAAHAVARFTEKPDVATARELMQTGALWNSGLFAWTARRLLQEIRQHTPEIAPHLELLQRGEVARFFEAVTPISIDVGLLERSSSVAVVRGEFPWDDVGTWDALPRVRAPDVAGNVAIGPVFLRDTQDCVAWSDGEPVVLSGVRDLVVVRANGRVLVLHRSRAAELKQVLDALPAEVREV